MEAQAVRTNSANGYITFFNPFNLLHLGIMCSLLVHTAALEEVEDPPETVACHTETPHMLRLRSSYIKENSQVRQTPTTLKGATRDDEGRYVA